MLKRHLYHEKQSLWRCAVHTLNNLLQDNWISHDILCEIAGRLHETDKANGLSSSFDLNPYRSAIPYIGYFDVACIVEALKLQKCSISHHIAKGDEIESTSFTENNQIIGIIVNAATSSLFGLMPGRHWFAIIRCATTSNDSNDGAACQFVNVDSELREPSVFPDEGKLKKFILDGFASHSYQIFIVVRDESSP